MKAILGNYKTTLLCFLLALLPGLARSQTTIPLVNYSFETNSAGAVFTEKVSTGFDTPGNEVAGWNDVGPGNNNCGVDYAGDNGLTAEDGTVCAWSQGGQPGAYQVTGYQIQAGDQLTLTWWAKSTYNNAGQKVELLGATNMADVFTNLTVLATSTASLNNTGNGGAYTQYTLNFVAATADVGEYVAVSFCANTVGNNYAAFDNFNLTVQPPPPSLGPPTVVPIPANPVYYYANDSRFPYFPNSNGTANVTYWVDGVNYRSQGPSLDHMNPISSTNSVLSATAGVFDNGGVWMLAAIRSTGTLYGFYHAEDHSCVPYTEWNSTGLATSTDDGYTWSKQGEIIGSPNPCGAFGGVNACTVAWDERNSRWMAWGGPDCFVSTNAQAAPGTWYAYDDGSFSSLMPGTGAVTGLPTLNGNISVESVAWNSYLGKWVMVYNQWGNQTNIFWTTSTDGITWESQATLLSVSTNQSLGYVQIIGTTGETCGQDALLVYESSPSVQSPATRSRDMIEQWIHWGMSSVPTTPTNLTANGQWSCGPQAVLNWSAVNQAQSYNILRSTSSSGPYTNIAGISTSDSFPTYTDLSIADGRTYYYEVQATNTAGASAYSSVVSVVSDAAVGNIISINFVGGTTGVTNTQMGCGEVAGVAVVSIWNNAVGATGTLVNLAYNAGASSSASVTWSSPNTWSTGISDTPGNYRLMEGYLDGSTPSVTVSNMPATFTNSGYNVYVYCNGNDYSGRTGQYQIGSQTNEMVDAAVFSGTFVQATNSAGNYILFTNLTVGQFTLISQGIGGGDGILRAPVNGIQLVSLAGGNVQLPGAASGLSGRLVSGEIQVSWPMSQLGWSLQMQMDTIASGLGTNWVDVPNSLLTTQMLFPISNNENVFFRLAPPNGSD